MAKKGLMARIIEGPERSETYARSTLPTNRWELGWDVFKTNKGKLCGLNLLTLIFLVPAMFLILIRFVLKANYTEAYPFAQNMGVSYPIFPSGAGLEANLSMFLNVQVFKYVYIAVAIGAIGISGGFYVMRNLVWTEGVMVTSDFFKGVKKNYFVVLFSLIIYATIMMLSLTSINMSTMMLETHRGPSWLLVMAQVITYFIMVLSTMMILYMFTLGINYKLSFKNLIRNSFILSIALIPTNAFFILFAAVWFILLFLNMQFVMFIAIMLCFFWGFSLFMLIWTNYSHWVFDKFINDKVPGAKKNRGIYKANATEEDGEALVIEKSKVKEKHVKPITDYDVEIYELPTSFSRKDLEKLEETKEAMRIDSDKYAEEYEEESAKSETIDELMKAEEKDSEAK